MSEAINIILCSNCFGDQGLKLDAINLGVELKVACPNCRSTDGLKLDKKVAMLLVQRFFVRGSFHKLNYGGAPIIQFNEGQYGKNKGEFRLKFTGELSKDVDLLEETLKIGFFPYGPHLWMLGEIQPLLSLQDSIKRTGVVEDIFSKYPSRTLSVDDVFYRLRVAPQTPEEPLEFDSPPVSGIGRFDSPDFSILYGSQDINVCIHECRSSIDDDIYVATLKPNRELRLLDLTEVLIEDVTPFESLDMAVHQLFLAGNHSYSISREIARTARMKGYDGLIYPSYFSLVRSGAMPIETFYGIPIRRLPPLKERAQNQIIPNIAIFGKPIKEGNLLVSSINRLVINRVAYDICFGPVEW